jgi:hypothetical protein
MSQAGIVTIIRDQIQKLRMDKLRVITKFENIEKRMKLILSEMDEVDDRRIDGIDILEHGGNLKGRLQELFDITEDELATNDQKQRFAAELERAEIVLDMMEIENRIASCNKRLLIVDPTLTVFGIENYDQKSLEVYGNTVHLETSLRNLIIDVLEPEDKGWWSKLPQGVQESANEGYEEAVSKIKAPENMLRRIDFIDFSHYEGIFTGNKVKNMFFGGSPERMWGMVTKLSELRELRNKIMHRPPLNDDEYAKFQMLYSDVLGMIKKIRDEYEK